MKMDEFNQKLSDLLRQAMVEGDNIPKMIDLLVYRAAELGVNCAPEWINIDKYLEAELQRSLTIAREQ